MTFLPSVFFFTKKNKKILVFFFEKRKETNKFLYPPKISRKVFLKKKSEVTVYQCAERVVGPFTQSFKPALLKKKN